MLVMIIKEKENLVCDTVEKEEYVVIFGLKEKVMPVRHERRIGEKAD